MAVEVQSLCVLDGWLWPLPLVLGSCSVHVCSEGAQAIPFFAETAGYPLPALVAEGPMSELPLQHSRQGLEVPLLRWV